MYETEKRLFGQALAEVISKTLDEELRGCKETAACSRVHSRCMHHIIRFGELPKVRRINKRTVALIIAAALLLTGCAALARDQIAGFFMTILETRNVIESPVDVTEYPKTIEEKRIPQVLPEGYELVEETFTDCSLYITWKNDLGELLTYSQDVHDGHLFSVDNEHGEWTEKEICGVRVLFYDHMDDEIQFLWMDEYVYHIYSSRELSQQEIANVIENTK